jgi:hypothetical protein
MMKRIVTSMLLITSFSLYSSTSSNIPGLPAKDNRVKLLNGIVLSSLKSIDVNEIQRLVITSIQMMMKFIENFGRRLAPLLSEEQKALVYEPLKSWAHASSMLATYADKDINSNEVKEQALEAFMGLTMVLSSFLAELKIATSQEAVLEKTTLDEQIQKALLNGYKQGMSQFKDVVEKTVQLFKPTIATATTSNATSPSPSTASTSTTSSNPPFSSNPTATSSTPTQSAPTAAQAK